MIFSNANLKPSQHFHDKHDRIAVRNDIESLKAKKDATLYLCEVGFSSKIQIKTKMKKSAGCSIWHLNCSQHQNVFSSYVRENSSSSTLNSFIVNILIDNLIDWFQWYINLCRVILFREVRELHILYVYIYLFSVVDYERFLHTITRFQVFLSNKNNLYKVLWFQGFLSHINFNLWSAKMSLWRFLMFSGTTAEFEWPECSASFVSVHLHLKSAYNLLIIVSERAESE